MQRGAEVKVGLIVLLAALLVGYFVFAIRGVSSVETYPIYVTFANAQGLQRGDPVQMAGVKVGEVRSVTLKGQQALVELAIDKRFPVFANYRVQVTSSGLLQERFVDIIPAVEAERGARLPPKATVQGTSAADLTQLMQTGQELLVSVNRSAKALEKIMGNEQTAEQFQQAIANLAEASDNAVELTATASGIAHASGPQVQETLASLRRAANDIEAATGVIRTQIARGEIVANVEETTRQAARLSHTLNAVADSLASFTADPTLQADMRDTITDLRATVADLRAAAADARGIAADLKVVSGAAREAAPAIPKAVEGATSLLQTASQIQERLKPPQIQPSFEILAGGSDIFSAARIDLSWTGDRFYRLGVDDIGVGTTGEAQVGDRRGRRALRYGLYRSQLAVGLDVPVSHTAMLSATLFDPNNPRIDALFGMPVLHDRTDISLLVGGRDLGDEPTLVGGVRFTR